ncbi:hypothetical protein H1C71_008441, partial [Ictidomys tridecemlineatus]
EGARQRSGGLVQPSDPGDMAPFAESKYGSECSSNNKGWADHVTPRDHLPLEVPLSRGAEPPGFLRKSLVTFKARRRCPGYKERRSDLDLEKELMMLRPF